MSSTAHQNEASTGGPVEFAETQWSLILKAQQPDSSTAQPALASLCQTYWYPLYAFIRRCGHDSHDAKDLTQGFFARFLEKDFLHSVDRGKGRFRSFLLAAVKHFVANERDRARARKRGGGYTFVSLDETLAEHRYRHEPAHDVTAEKLYERSWAMTLLEAALEELRQEYASTNRECLFEVLHLYMSGETQAPSYAEAAARLEMTEAAVKMAVLRLRRRFGQLLRTQVAHTVNSPAEVEDELRSLFAALRR